MMPSSLHSSISCLLYTSDKALFEDAIEFAKMGGTIDITTGIGPEYGLPDSVKPSEAVRRCLEAGVDIERITMSSDANGSMAVYDEDGTFKGLFVTTVESMFSEFRDIVLKENLPLETAIRVVSTNAAKSIGMYPRKGEMCIRDSPWRQASTMIPSGISCYVFHRPTIAWQMK